MKFLIVIFFATLASMANAQNGNFHLDKEYPINATGTLRLSSSDARVIITGSNRKTAHVKIDHELNTHGITLGSSSFSVDVKDTDGNLELTENSHLNSGVIGYSNEKYTILLELPSTVSLMIRGDDGNYRIENIAGSIALNTDDADAELRGCTGNQFSFHIGDGKIKMDQGTGKLTIDGKDAEISINHGAFSEMTASINDGTLEIESSLVESGKYSLRAQDGTIALSILSGSGGSFTVRHDDGNVYTEGKFSIIEKSDDETRLSLSDGKAKVEIRVNDGRVKLVSR